MRIILNGWFWGQSGTGTGQYLGQLLSHLPDVAPGDEFVLVIWRRHAPAASPPSGFQGTRHPVIMSTPFDRFNENFSKLWFEQVTFPRACRRLGGDVAHVPHWGSPLCPTLPTVVTIHDIIPLILPAYRSSRSVRAYTRLVATASRRMAAVIAVSESSRRDIVDHLSLPPERVWVTPEAAPDDMHRVDQVAVDAVRHKYDLPRKFFLYLGGFDVRKNVPGLLAAFAQFLADAPSADEELVVAGLLPQGHSQFTPDPVPIAQALGVESRVCFPGWVDERDKAALFSAATGLVFPSEYEGFGLPVLEAMACGTPVIASNVSSLPELVGEAGLLVSPSDMRALAAAMLRLSHDHSLRAKLSRQGLEQVARFSWRQTAESTSEVYRSLQDQAARSTEASSREV